MEAVSGRVQEFFREKGQEANLKDGFLLLRICGYSSGHMLPEVWQVAFQNETWSAPSCIQPEDNFGPRWNRENEALDRLILGIGSVSEDGAKALGMTPQQIEEAANKLYPNVQESDPASRANPGRHRPGALHGGNDEGVHQIRCRATQDRRWPDGDRGHHEA